ncbi:MAG: aldo/keto reductase [Spirochaetes bacterium]|nr:aldo/keto reductase [Spirochaetota bacterium]
MEKRMLGNTGEEVSMLGLGGFHLLEISDKDAVHLLNTYFDEGGNYVETAPQYGDGESERKVGLVMKKRRDECLLATKSHLRDAKGAEVSINESLKRLQTDHIDLLILHHVQGMDELNQILGPGGALEAFIEARERGKIRFIGISGHGVPDVLIEALNRYVFDAVMIVINFFDRFNFPQVEVELIPLALEKGTGIVGMKALADGLLWEYPEESLRYALTLPIAVMACGFNTVDMLVRDLRIVNSFRPMSEKEKEDMFKNNPVLGNYICRLCNKCLPCPEGINIPEIFTYEGWYDRQLRDRAVHKTPEFALRDRLRFWFDNRDKARIAYEGVEKKADACTACGDCIPRCPYGLDIISKLDNAHYKLTREASAFIPI